jgi:signal transduction histidine kinase
VPDLTPRAFDVHLLIEDALRHFSALARDKGVTLDVKAAATVPEQAIGEETWLREVLFGLIDNALKFTDSGEVVASITSDCTAGGRALFHVEVSDTGSGMTAETLARLFGPPRGPLARAAALDGAGGGSLLVAQRLIELMDGRIGCSSAVGMGTTTWFTVPLDLPPR